MPETKEQPIPRSIRTIGQRLRYFREQRGLSLRGLDDLTGIPYATISRIENDKREPTISTLQAIADALKIPMRNFF